jgi:membrane-bound lytic murein transglycosylase D
LLSVQGLSLTDPCRHGNVDTLETMSPGATGVDLLLTIMMFRRPRWSRLAAACLVLASAACGRSAVSQPPVTSPLPVRLPVPEAPPPTPPAPQPDPVILIIAISQEHFDAGQAELQRGHLEKAKAAFNQALDILLEYPAGARSDARLQEHFDRLVVRISAFELRALAEGDGFAERPSVPAFLDELLAIAPAETPAVQPDLQHTVEADLASTTHDVPIPVNAKVLAYVDLFQGRLRDWFQISLQRSVAYMPMIQAAFRAEGLPLDLAYIPIVESAFRTDALSRAKAKGVWQLMRGTGVENGLKYDWYVDERSDPEKATTAAVKYLRALNRMFNGDWHLTLASYNGGPGTVQSAIRRRKANDFWTLAEKGRYLPRETKEYVPMVLAAIVIARNPARYGFTLEPVTAEAPDSVSVSGPVDLRRVAEWSGVTLDEIRRLNPELSRMTTPIQSAKYEHYVLKVPTGTALGVVEQLSSASSEELTVLQWHTVKRGETLQSIANKLAVRRTDLAEANFLRAGSAVTPGQRLVIPRTTTKLLAARPDRPDSVLVPARPASTEKPAASTEAAATDLAKVTYRVKAGDTLTSIALAFRTTVDRLRTWNSLRGDRIVAGDRLTIYTNRGGGGRPRP